MKYCCEPGHTWNVSISVCKYQNTNCSSLNGVGFISNDFTEPTHLMSKVKINLIPLNSCNYS